MPKKCCSLWLQSNCAKKWLLLVLRISHFITDKFSKLQVIMMILTGSFTSIGAALTILMTIQKLESRQEKKSLNWLIVLKCCGCRSVCVTCECASVIFFVCKHAIKFVILFPWQCSSVHKLHIHMLKKWNQQIVNTVEQRNGFQIFLFSMFKQCDGRNDFPIAQWILKFNRVTFANGTEHQTTVLCIMSLRWYKMYRRRTSKSPASLITVSLNCV